MTTQALIETITETEVQLRVGEKSFRLPLSLIGPDCAVGETVWLSFDLNEPVATQQNFAKPTSPQAILNEILHPDDLQRAA